MSPKNGKELLALQEGAIIQRHALRDLIIGSKKADSSFWEGAEFSIGNTPQQGINWIGVPPNVAAVIIRTRDGSYAHDGWADDNEFTYSLKAREGVVNPAEKANAVLIDQPTYGYPVMLFTEHDGWRFDGRFNVTSVLEDRVRLRRSSGETQDAPRGIGEVEFLEGGKYYRAHLISERSAQVVKLLKSLSEPVCEICELNIVGAYGVNCIEAHHKRPISERIVKHVVTVSDFALLCPNCHRATHAYMIVKPENGYSEIKTFLQSRLTSSHYAKVVPAKSAGGGEADG